MGVNIANVWQLSQDSICIYSHIFESLGTINRGFNIFLIIIGKSNCCLDYVDFSIVS